MVQDLNFYNNYKDILVMQSLTEINKNSSSYNSIKSNKYLKAAIKRYLYSHVRSNFLRVNVDEMALAKYLPAAQFQGRTLGGVFAGARRNF